MVDFLQAVVLGVIQGLTEFLPISSSAHLRIFPELLRLGRPGRGVHRGDPDRHRARGAHLLLARHLADRRRPGLQSLFRPEYRGQLDARMGWFIIIGSLPIVVLGVLLKDVIEQRLPQPVDHRRRR